MESLPDNNLNPEIQPKHRGRPPKVKTEDQQPNLEIVANIVNDDTSEVYIKEIHSNEEIELLKAKYEQLEEENSVLKQLIESISVTAIKPLITCSDDVINKLYINYLTNKDMSLSNCKIVNVDDKLLILKSYYEIG